MSIITKRIILIFIILIIAFFAFLPSLKNGFVWDDVLFVTENKTIQSLSLQNIKNIFTSFHNGLYRPLVFLSFALEYNFFKDNPAAYHMTNLILHLANCLLAFLLIFLISNNLTASFVAVILFAIHPLRVESVVWITERKDVLSTFFLLGTLVFFVLYNKSNLKKHYYLSLFSFILSLFTKLAGVTIPIVLLLFDYFTGKKLNRKVWVNKIPFFVIAAIITVVNVYSFSQSHGQETTPLAISSDSFFIATHGLIFYLKKIFQPIRLSCLYPYPEKTNGLLPLPFLLSPIILLSIIIVILLISKYTRKIIFGSVFFLVTIFPILFLAPTAPGIAAADRYTYIPSIGIFYLMGEFFSWLYTKKCKNLMLCKLVIMNMLVGIIGILSFLTYERTKLWKNDITLWSNVLKHYPYNDTAHLNIGAFYCAEGNYTEALRHAQVALSLSPDAWDVYMLMGNIFYAKNELEEALDYYKKALILNPESYRAFYNTGLAYEAMGRYDKALNNYKMALEINPSFWHALQKLSKLLIQKKSYNEALKVCEEVLKLYPSDVQALTKKGIVLAEKGNSKEAEAVFKEALRFDPYSIDALKNLAALHGNQGQIDKAILFFKKVLEINPDNEEVKKSLDIAVELKDSLVK